jgi:predicted metal-dependent phosphoesterase TrpH
MTTGSDWLRADLHVHSYHSGYASHMRFLRTRDCYSDPDDVYRVAKARGMNLVTITDHDSIDGCLEFLERHPDAADFFISEEVECAIPELSTKAHIGVYGLTERMHRDLQPLRANAYDVAAYLREQNVCFALNHLFFFYRRSVPFDRYIRALLPLFPAFELRNGAMLEEHNELICAVIEAAFAGRVPPGGTAGSDSHTLRRIGRTYTEAEGGNREDFLRNIRIGRSRVGGAHGSALGVAAEIYGVVSRYWATLAGFGRPDLSWQTRVVGAVCSVASIPVEFLPLLIAVLQKRVEARTVAACRDAFESAHAARSIRQRASSAAMFVREPDQS